MASFGFGFSEEQELFRQEVRRFALKELAPGAADRARKHEPFPRQLIRRIADLGIWGLTIDPRYGGQGDTGYLVAGIATEEIARADFNAPNPLSPVALGKLLESWAADSVKEAWIPRLVRGEVTLALALTEPEAGSDAAAITTRAWRNGDGYIIAGQKTGISRAPYADAAVIFAKTDPSAGPRGVTAFFVPLDHPGVVVTALRDTGWRPAGRGVIFLDDVHIPEEWRLGEEGQGFRQVMNTFDFVRAGLALQALGAAQTSLEEAAEYAKQRKTFGQPLVRYEAISFKLAEHWTMVEAARLLCYRTLWLRDQNLPHTKEAAMCKWWAPKLAHAAIHDSMLVFGHMAYSTELPIEQRLRDVMALEFADGTADIMKIVVAREMVGREALPY